MGVLRPAPLLLIAVLSIGLAGCATHSVDESAYVRANRQVLRSVPRLPASQLVSSYTMGDRSGNGWPEDGGPFTAYVSYYTYSTPAGWDASRVLQFYERRLRSSGWTLTTSWSNERTFLKEPATLHITASGRDVVLSVNHDRHADGER